MELSTHEQVLGLVRAYDKILIALPQNPSSDAIAAGIALASVLKSLGKDTKIASSNFQLPPTLGFLPNHQNIHTGLDANRKLVISLNLKNASVGELSYEVKGKKLNIFITPKEGGFNKEDVDAQLADYDFQLIITLDAQSLSSMGNLFEANADFFYQTPIINIDHHSANDSFGQVNLVDLVATSTSEMVLEIVQGLKPDLIDDTIATNLLTGIITKTRCFRTSSVTPKVLAAASQLIEAGAKREEIIKHLYQTRTLPTLKLWGRALARLKEDYRGQYVWTLLSRQDFEKSGAGEKDLQGVIDELIVYTPKARVILVIYEAKDGKIKGLVFSFRQVSNTELFKAHSPQGSDDFAALSFSGNDLEATEAQMKDQVGEYLKNQGYLG
ncbi:MAG: DHH family phosphoesterase [bacterium]